MVFDILKFGRPSLGAGFETCKCWCCTVSICCGWLWCCGFAGRKWGILDYLIQRIDAFYVVTFQRCKCKNWWTLGYVQIPSLPFSGMHVTLSWACSWRDAENAIYYNPSWKCTFRWSRRRTCGYKWNFYVLAWTRDYCFIGCIYYCRFNRADIEFAIASHCFAVSPIPISFSCTCRCCFRANHLVKAAHRAAGGALSLYLDAWS